MSSYRAAAYDPKRGTIRTASWLDDYFGRHLYGVRFDDDGPVWRQHDVDIPLDVEFVRAK